MNRVSHHIASIFAALNFVTLSLVAPLALAQEQQNDDSSSGSRPGILQRTPDPATENDPDEENEQTDSQNTDPQQADPQPSDPDEVQVRGPNVVTSEDLGIGENGFNTNFPDGPFDPFDPPNSTRVQIDFNEAALNDVVMWISALTGRNFIIADSIGSDKKITIISPQPVSIAEAYRAFIAALNMNGLTVVPFGRFLKIVPSTDAVRNAIEPTTREGQIPNDDRMVTHIHRLEHVSISNVQSILEAMKTESASIIPYEPTNTLIITETGTNLHRLLGVLEELDVPSGQERIFMYQVQYASAEELRSVLLEIFQQESESQTQSSSRNSRSSRTTRNRRNRNSEEASSSESRSSESPASVSVSQIIADPRTNQLIIIANRRSYERIIEIARQLDVPIPGEGQVHVMFLENADATELASTLQSLTQSIEQQRNDTGNTSGTRPRSRDSESSSSSGTSEGAVSATLSGDVSITADESTNSLIVVADLRDFIALRDVIDQLDRPRQQVYVEAVIMEATINRQTQFGIALNSGALPSIGGEDVPVFGATSLGGLSSVLMDPTSLMGLAVGLRGPEIEGTSDLFGINLPSFGAIMQAMQINNDVNILSTPHILTMDNEEAEIVVGENIPFISGISSGGLGGGLGSISSMLGDDSDIPSSALGALGGLGGFGGGVQIQRQDVALTLRITPHINESNFVRLEIEEEVEDVQSIDPVLGPRTTTRQANTTVVVRDQQTVVIGGLMRDSQIEDVTKVPFLGDIPVLGHLFRNTSSRTVKTNLLLLLTPYIIRDPSDFQEIFRRKMEEREEFIAYFGQHDREYVAGIDYARKDGPLQTMFESISEAIERDEERRRAFSTPTEESNIDSPINGTIRIQVENEESQDNSGE